MAPDNEQPSNLSLGRDSVSNVDRPARRHTNMTFYREDSGGPHSHHNA